MTDNNSFAQRPSGKQTVLLLLLDTSTSACLFRKANPLNEIASKRRVLMKVVRPYCLPIILTFMFLGFIVTITGAEQEVEKFE